LRPVADNLGLDLVANLIDGQTLLPDCFLAFADGGIFRAALIERQPSTRR
jgi:hypothetical protein